MTRKEALELFGISEQATRDEVTRRYDILVRKMKAGGNAPGVPDRDQVDAAYRLLAEIEYHDPAAEKRLRERNARPGPVARLLKMEQTRLDNLVHYYRVPVLGGLLGIVLLVWILATTVFSPPNDFTMLLAGNVYVEDQDMLEQKVMDLLPETQNPMISGIYFDETTDGQMLSAVTQKLMVEIGYGENDILVVDRGVFAQYAEQGAFLPFSDEQLARYGTSATEQESQRLTLDEDSLLDGEDGQPKIYGISVTESLFLKETGVLGLDLVAAFGLRGKFPEKGDRMMKAITAK